MLYVIDQISHKRPQLSRIDLAAKFIPLMRGFYRLDEEAGVATGQPSRTSHLDSASASIAARTHVESFRTTLSNLSLSSILGMTGGALRTMVTQKRR